MINILKDDERIDNLHRNNYIIIQNPKKFCFGIDSVLLSDFAKAKKGDKVFDIGTGTGILPILMSAKTKASSFYAIDVQQDSVDMAKRSVILNNLQHKITIEHLDIKNVFSKFKKADFDVVVTNPPYMNNGSGFFNSLEPKTIARHEVLCDLKDILKNSSDLLKPNGKLFMVHRPNRLTDIIFYCKTFKLEPKVIRFVQPYNHKEANMVLIQAIKNANPFLKVLPNLIIYDENKKYTKEINDIYYN